MPKGELAPFPFPGHIVIQSFRNTEDQLAGVLEHVPYDPAHAAVWSPALATILLEACSQLDSLWKYELRHQTPPITKERLNIKDYFEHVGRQVRDAEVVLWAGEHESVKPFDAWSAKRTADHTAYRTLGFWSDYNDVKHDRLRHHQAATLESAVQAVAGLFAAILECPFAADHVAEAGWVGRPPAPHPTAGGARAEIKAAESRLFSGQIRIDRKGQIGPQRVGTYASYRLYSWCKRTNTDPDLHFP